ncbi:hypothetical protein EBT31_04770 [bacterium]|nr:hypothetical protein [bacterium]
MDVDEWHGSSPLIRCCRRRLPTFCIPRRITRSSITSNFESSGYLFIGSEFIQYTGKTATTFTGITRGVLGTTNVAHAIGTAVTESAATAAGGSAGVKLDTTSYSYGVSFDTTNKTRIYFDYPGIYNLQFSAQLVNFTTTDDNVTFWLRKNGTDVPYTAGIAAAVSKHGTSPGAAIVWRFRPILLGQPPCIRYRRR